MSADIRITTKETGDSIRSFVSADAARSAAIKVAALHGKVFRPGTVDVVEYRVVHGQRIGTVKERVWS